MSGIVVIGGGQAGSSLTAKLRALGYEGDVTLVGEEPVPPYQRPPLSKAYLMGEMEAERLYLRPRDFYDEQGIALKLGARVEGIDRAAKTVTVGGEVLGYDQLALTTGSVPRRLPAAIGGALDGVFEVRTLADVDRMAPKFREGARVLVIGGGYIGLEAAAVASQEGAWRSRWSRWPNASCSGWRRRRRPISSGRCTPAMGWISAKAWDWRG